MFVYILIGVVMFITLVIAVSYFIKSDGDDTGDGGYDPHSG